MPSFFRLNEDLAIHTAGPVVKKDDYVAWLESETLVAEAREEASKIISDAKEAFEAERRRGFEEGLESGLTVARESSEAHHKELSASYADKLVEIHEEIPALIAGAVKKLLGEMPSDDLLTKIVSQTLKHPSLKGDVSIHANNLEYEILKERFEGLSEEHKDIHNIEVVKDHAVDPGRFKLNSGASIIDSSPKEQLDALQKSILETGPDHGFKEDE